MFDKPFDLARRRNGEEALGFYLVQLVILIVISLLIEHLFGNLTGNGVFGIGIRIEAVLTAIWSLVLAVVIVRQHRTTQGGGYWLLVILTGILGLLGSGLFGLLIPAYLTTKR